jgi:predicted  nucleic acid-binding Zn-ribbon protein
LQNRDRRCTETAVSIDLDSLKAERDKLKDGLRELEAEQRKVDAELKALRQREIQTKREIEALGTLIEINEGRAATKDGG